MRDPSTFTPESTPEFPAVPSDRPRPAVTLLTIGGVDPLGGAGVTADARTCAAHGAGSATVVAALTAQNHRGVHAVRDAGADFVRLQLAAVLAQVTPDAAKTGMLLDKATVAAVADGLKGWTGFLVVDPVLSATAGGTLARTGLLDALAAHLLPRAAVVTPNLDEAAAALGAPVPPDGLAAAARVLRARWRTAAVLLKGGHAGGHAAVDVLATADATHAFSLPRLPVANGHGSGCALATSLALRLARGDGLLVAVAGAKAYLHRALAAAQPLGAGRGPVRHDVPTDAGAPVTEVTRIG